MSGTCVIRISPMAHFASGFLALSLLVLVPVWGNRALALLVIPALLVAARVVSPDEIRALVRSARGARGGEAAT